MISQPYDSSICTTISGTGTGEISEARKSRKRRYYDKVKSNKEFKNAERARMKKYRQKRKADDIKKDEEMVILKCENEELKLQLEFVKTELESIKNDISMNVINSTNVIGSFIPSKYDDDAVDEGDVLYFDSYSSLGIHEEMLLDTVRTNTYREAISLNPTDFTDKVVLDVGCGTGVLSMFAAKAGARKVYAIDASDIVFVAYKLVVQNNLSDKIVVIKGCVENIVFPEKVDVIISEWMGYLLLYESMVKSVLYARDNFLKPGGKLFPNHAEIFLCPFTDNEGYLEKMECWMSGKRNYDLDFSPVLPIAKEQSFKEPLVDTISPSSEISFAIPIHQFSLDTVSCEGAMNVNQIPFKFQCHRQCMSPTYLAKTTHWEQVLLFLDDPVKVDQDSVIEGLISIHPHNIHNRFLKINIKCEVSPGVDVRTPMNAVTIEKEFELK